MFSCSKQNLSRQTIILLSRGSLRATGCVDTTCTTAAPVGAAGLVKMSPVPRLKDSRGSSFGLLGLLGHSFVIMTSDLCRPVCWEECRRCLPSVRLMVSRWLLGCFSELLSFYPPTSNQPHAPVCWNEVVAL